ncbi:hypothetical protein JCM17960_15120 [Magnetospira thiophila]
MNRTDLTVVSGGPAPDRGGVEMPLEELLRDAAMRALMSSDGVRQEELVALMNNVRHRLALAAAA